MTTETNRPMSLFGEAAERMADRIGQCEAQMTTATAAELPALKGRYRLLQERFDMIRYHHVVTTVDDARRIVVALEVQ